MEISAEKVGKIIRDFESNRQPRLVKLRDYYLGKHKILEEEKGKNKPNNRLVTNYAKSIVSNTTGYYMGTPVTYSSSDENLKKEIDFLAKYNDDAFHNAQLAKDISVFGYGIEVVYFDNDLQIRYAKLNPIQTYIGYSDDIEKNIIYALRWYDVTDDNNKTTRYVEQYTESEIIYYTMSGKQAVETERKQHYFGDVPVNPFNNNEELRGDFEDVISLIDAYNVMQSESVNDFQKFADALLFVKNMSVDEETAGKMRDYNILEGFEDGEASWLVKNVNDAYVENIKNRIEKDIYASSNTVNLSDENFANNASGVAIQYKLINFENRVGMTERYFKKGLQRRFELICNALDFKGASYDYTTIGMTFKRNLPTNTTETAQIVSQLHGKVSNETLLGLLSFVDDVQAELKRMKNEQGDYSGVFEGAE